MIHGFRMVWYWPGVRCQPDELAVLLGLLAKGGVQVLRLRPDYDRGLPPWHPDSPFRNLLTGPEEEKADWWLGLSLGAAVAACVAATIEPQARPARLTLINPVVDRAALARERGFLMEKGWELRLTDLPPPSVSQLDLVISAADERVPAWHGESFREHCIGHPLSYFSFDADHTFSSPSTQERLAVALLQGTLHAALA